MLKKQIISFALIIVGFILGATAIQVLAQTSTWVAPQQTPTGGNVAAPINVDYGGQVKFGNLSLNALANAGGTFLQYGLLVQNSPVKAAGGLIIQTCSTSTLSCPGDGTHPVETGQMWLVQ